MIQALYSGLSGLQANQLGADVAANNVANLTTPGFQASRLNVEEASPAGTGVTATSTTRSAASGPLLQTGNPTDLAISGSGYFQVRQPNGQVGYTRNGSFTVDAQGNLRTADGGTLLGAGGPIQAPANAALSVGADGTVTAATPGGGSQAAGAVSLAGFPDAQGLSAQGGGLFAATGASGAAQAGAPGTNGLGGIVSGALEISNVDTATEMVNLIVSQRGFEANAKVIHATDDMLKKAYDLLR